MKNHICYESTICSCNLSAMDPDDYCPIHGAGCFPPRCTICGRFLKRRIEQMDTELSKKLVMVDKLPQATYSKYELGTLKVPNYLNKSSKERVNEMSTYCECEKPVRKSEKYFCHQCNKEIERKPKISEINRKKLKEFTAKYNDKDIRYMYIYSLIRPEINITVVSKMNRDKNTLTVAFSFCSPKDTFSRRNGKVNCFEILEDKDNAFVATVPWLDDGFLTVGYAFNKIAKPEKLKMAKFDSLRLRGSVDKMVSYYLNY